MKEATGELNVTLIVVMAVGILVAFFYFTIWPSLNANFEANSNCSRAICENPCGDGSGRNSCDEMTNTLAKCHIKDSSTIIYCPWKG
ncbi:MAG: hypothetical protein IJ572_00145 [Bacilli bacterium]|nr:hypothetical protein [Bacilli bacterium]